MVLPLYLAMMDREMQDSPTLPPHIARMGCTFDPDGPGLLGLPEAIPPDGMLLVDDRHPVGNHDPALVAQALAETVDRLGIDGILLDFERPPTSPSLAMAACIAQALPCPVGMPPAYGAALDSPLFLSPCPPHVPMEEYLKPWHHREIWMEARMLRQTITVTPEGTVYGIPSPADNLTGGYFDNLLRCQCITKITDDNVIFTLYDTPETLRKKWNHPTISRAIGLYQDWYRT